MSHIFHPQYSYDFIEFFGQEHVSLIKNSEPIVPRRCARNGQWLVVGMGWLAGWLDTHRRSRWMSFLGDDDRDDDDLNFFIATPFPAASNWTKPPQFIFLVVHQNVSATHPLLRSLPRADRSIVSGRLNGIYFTVRRFEICFIARSHEAVQSFFTVTGSLLERYFLVEWGSLPPLRFISESFDVNLWKIPGSENEDHEIW